MEGMLGNGVQSHEGFGQGVGVLEWSIGQYRKKAI